MDYKLNLSDPNVSTTLDKNDNSDNWSISNLYESDFTMEELREVIITVDKFKRKYRNDDTIQAFDEIVRDEMCHLFGGSLDTND